MAAPRAASVPAVVAPVVHLERIEERMAHQFRHGVHAPVREQAAERRRRGCVVVLVNEQSRTYCRA